MFSCLFLCLESEFKCQSELLRHRNSHTSGVEELRILSVQLLVSIDEEKVRSLQLERHRVHLHRLYDLRRQLIGKRDLLHSDEVSARDALRGVVVGIIGITQ